MQVRQTNPGFPPQFEVVALYDYPGLGKGDLQLTKGERVTVFNASVKNWYRARNQQG